MIWEKLKNLEWRTMNFNCQDIKSQIMVMGGAQNTCSQDNATKLVNTVVQPLEITNDNN